MTAPKKASGTKPKGFPGQGHLITFQVRDLAETRTRLCDAGLAPTPIETHPWGATVMYLDDPEGNRLEFWC